ncbi:hypothetical protein M1116_01875 [Patescibacteria group bacterium]|nr:hypothetical protein [Patescibacteria group bacterium]
MLAYPVKASGQIIVLLLIFAAFLLFEGYFVLSQNRAKEISNTENLVTPTPLPTEIPTPTLVPSATPSAALSR